MDTSTVHRVDHLAIFEGMAGLVSIGGAASLTYQSDLLWVGQPWILLETAEVPFSLSIVVADRDQDDSCLIRLVDR